MYDVALAVGMEKLYHEDKRRSFQAIGAAVDVEWMQQMQAQMRQAKGNGERGDMPAPEEGAGEKRSMFLDFYAAFARQHMAKYGTTKEQFARVAVKNHFHGSPQHHAHAREGSALEGVRDSRP